MEFGTLNTGRKFKFTSQSEKYKGKVLCCEAFFKQTLWNGWQTFIVEVRHRDIEDFPIVTVADFGMADGQTVPQQIDEAIDTGSHRITERSKFKVGDYEEVDYA